LGKSRILAFGFMPRCRFMRNARCDDVLVSPKVKFGWVSRGNTVLRMLLGLTPAALAFAALALPWWMGQRVEQELDRVLVERLQQGPSGVTAQWVSYQRGWLAREAVSDWQIDARGPPGDGPLRFQLKHQIRHWPNLIDWRMASMSTTRLAGADEAPEWVALWPRVDSALFWDRRQQHQVHQGPQRVQAAEGAIGWEGVEGLLTVWPDRATGSLAWRGLQFETAPGTADPGSGRLGEITLRFDSQRDTSSALWLGESGVELKDLLVDSPDARVALKQLRFDSRAELQQGLLQLLWQLRLESLDGEVRSGPEAGRQAVDWSQLELQWALARLDPQVILRLQGLAGRMQGAGAGGERRALGMQAVLELAPLLLASQPELRLEQLRMATAAGAALQGEGRLAYRGGTSLLGIKPRRDLEGHLELKAPEAGMDALEPLFLGYRVYLDRARAAMGAPPIEDAEWRELWVQQLAQLEAAGLLLRDGQGYRVRLELNGDAGPGLRVNGEAVAAGMGRRGPE